MVSHVADVVELLEAHLGQQVDRAGGAQEVRVVDLRGGRRPTCSLAELRSRGGDVEEVAQVEAGHAAAGAGARRLVPPGPAPRRAHGGGGDHLADVGDPARWSGSSPFSTAGAFISMTWRCRRTSTKRPSVGRPAWWSCPSTTASNRWRSLETSTAAALPERGVRSVTMSDGTTIGTRHLRECCGFLKLTMVARSSSTRRSVYVDPAVMEAGSAMDSVESIAWASAPVSTPPGWRSGPACPPCFATAMNGWSPRRRLRRSERSSCTADCQAVDEGFVDEFESLPNADIFRPKRAPYELVAIEDTAVPLAVRTRRNNRNRRHSLERFPASPTRRAIVNGIQRPGMLDLGLSLPSPPAASAEELDRFNERSACRLPGSLRRLARRVDPVREQRIGAAEGVLGRRNPEWRRPTYVGLPRGDRSDSPVQPKRSTSPGGRAG